MKRIVLFLATNMAIVLVLSFTMRLLGVEPYLNANGLNLGSLLVFAAVMGFGGSLISLAISKWSAKTAMGVHVIETPANSTEFWLVETIRKYASEAGIKMPEVGIYESPDVNAFATGMSKNSSLIAVSTGLLQQMTRQEAEAVLGHEVAHHARDAGAPAGRLNAGPVQHAVFHGNGEVFHAAQFTRISCCTKFV